MCVTWCHREVTHNTTQHSNHNTHNSKPPSSNHSNKPRLDGRDSNSPTTKTATTTTTHNANDMHAWNCGPDEWLERPTDCSRATSSQRQHPTPHSSTPAPAVASNTTLLQELKPSLQALLCLLLLASTCLLLTSLCLTLYLIGGVQRISLNYHLPAWVPLSHYVQLLHQLGFASIQPQDWTQVEAKCSYVCVCVCMCVSVSVCRCVCP